jgi:hypothetical protein
LRARENKLPGPQNYPQQILSSPKQQIPAPIKQIRPPSNYPQPAILVIEKQKKAPAHPPGLFHLSPLVAQLVQKEYLSGKYHEINTLSAANP